MKIIWTETALESYEEIVNYISYKFTMKEAVDFLDKTEAILVVISNNFEAGSRYKKTEYRKFLIAKQTYLFYKIENQTIYLSVFWNNAKNPLQLNTILRT
jgi:plasmid stabilization system protein ParE